MAKVDQPTASLQWFGHPEPGHECVNNILIREIAAIPQAARFANGVVYELLDIVRVAPELNPVVTCGRAAGPFQESACPPKRIRNGKLATARAAGQLIFVLDSVFGKTNLSRDFCATDAKKAPLARRLLGSTH